MDDIEDFVGDAGPERKTSHPARISNTLNTHASESYGVGIHAGGGANRSGLCSTGGECRPRPESKIVPGTQRIWMKTYGCSHNVSDTEYMAGILDSYGYNMTQDKEEADLWLINSCTVKDPSQAAFVNLVKKAQKQGKQVVVSGCVPQADRKVKGLEGVSTIGIHHIDRVVEVVEETLKGHTVQFLGTDKPLPRLDLPKIRKDKLVEIIPLSTGCLGNCTYCKTRHARGVLGSYEKNAIVGRAKQAIDQGVKEIWLSSEDTGAYGRDIGESLPALLNDLVAVLPHDVMLRVGMTNPPFILDHLDAIAEVLNHPNVFSFLHVPVQSGSDKVLKDMNREYTVAEFCRVVDFLRLRVPEVNVATDIICGFPYETEEEFEETMDLCRKYQFAIMNISQFYPRPGTKAAKMKRVKTEIVKARSRRLTKYFLSYQPFSYMKGRVYQAWVSSEISKSGHGVAHTKSYIKVLIPRDDNLIGRPIWIRVTDTAKFHVNADLISEEEFKASQNAATKSVTENNIGDESEPHTRAQWWVLAVAIAVLSIFAVFFKDFLF